MFADELVQLEWNLKRDSCVSVSKSSMVMGKEYQIFNWIFLIR